jgi:PrtD family type I secretion system ABC transporter
MVIAASVLISRAISPIHRLLTGWKEVAGARQAYEQLKSLLAEEPEEEPRMKLPPPAGRLAVSVTAVVPPGGQAPVLSALRFTVEPGGIVAVVGPSGSGKTCLTRLLVGVWRPTRGSVRLDGVEIAEWNPEELGPHLGYVPQEIEFFEGTVAENIARLGPLDADKAVEAARLIDAHAMILALPKGYDTRLGESGHALSAGQRQRIAMARAFYGMPRYVVMDEPNSNLDEPGEQALSRALTELKRRGCTVILTTHRPRLVGVVDFILVLRGGEQLRFGPAETMLGEVRRMKSAAVQRSGEAQA